MYNAELYQESNILQKRDARQCLEDYSNKIKWKNDGAIVIDIGCGDGGVTTSILKPFIPDNFKELVGCDISEHMVQYANANHATDCIRFTKLDIASDLPEQFCEKFDHAFSSYALHWIRNQDLVFSNIYDLLAREGHCLLVFVGYIRVYDMYRELTRIPRWSYGVDAVERFVPLYYDCQDPEKPIHEMMSRIGFTDVRVKCEEKEFIYYGEEIFRKAMLAISPFEVPLDMREDFYKDLMKVVASLKLAEYGDNDLDNQFTVKLNYKNIIVYGQK